MYVFIYREKTCLLCALSMYYTYDFTLNKRRRIGFYTLWKDTVCIYHYFTIGYMHINCDFNLNKRRWITIYTLWKDTVCIYHYFIKGYIHIKCDFNLNKRRRIEFYTLWYGMYISLFYIL